MVEDTATMAEVETVVNERTSLKILLGVTGSVATIKADQICEELLKLTFKSEAADLPIEVRVIVTETAKHFLPTLPEGVQVLDDAEEWKWSKRGDPVLHVELTKWADIFVVAPLDCLTLSKAVTGACNNLLSCTMMAWPLGDKDKPLVLCPSMNTKMWTNPATKINMSKIKMWPGLVVVPPISKKLMCGDVGVGAMEEPKKIAVRVQEAWDNLPPPTPKTAPSLRGSSTRKKVESFTMLGGIFLAAHLIFFLRNKYA